MVWKPKKFDGCYVFFLPYLLIFPRLWRREVFFSTASPHTMPVGFGPSIFPVFMGYTSVTPFYFYILPYTDGRRRREIFPTKEGSGMRSKRPLVHTTRYRKGSFTGREGELGAWFSGWGVVFLSFGYSFSWFGGGDGKR